VLYRANIQHTTVVMDEPYPIIHFPERYFSHKDIYLEPWCRTSSLKILIVACCKNRCLAKRGHRMLILNCVHIQAL
jgi:hypothetical protein